MKHKKTVFRYFITMAFAFAFVLGLTCGVSAANVPVSVSGNSGLTVSLNDNFTNSTTDVDAYMLSVSHSYWGTIIPGTGYTNLTYAITSDDVNVANDNQFSIRYNGNTYTCTITNYQVSYNSLGLGLASSSTAYQWQNRSLTLPSVTTPYNFLGWYSLSGTRYGGAGDNYSFAANTTLYAHYADRYTALFADADGTLYYQASGQAGDKITNPALVDPSKEGYNFTGWNTQPSGGGTAYVSGTSTYSADVVYYAQWTPKMYSYALTGTGDSATYTFTSSNHAYSTSTTDSYCYYGETLDLTIPTKTNYVFIGWQDQTDNLTYGNNVGGYIQYTVDGATTLTAKFIEDVDSFKLVMFVDGSTGEVYEYDYRHCDEDQVYSPTVTKTGYTLQGWANASNAADYIPANHQVDFSSYTDSGVKVYVADWLGDAHDLSYSGNFGTSTNVNSAFDSASNIANNTPVTYRTGDTLAFDCTGSNTTTTTDDVLPASNYRIAVLYITYYDGDQDQYVTAPVYPDDNGLATFTIPDTAIGAISYYAEAVRYIYTITDLTDTNLTATATVDGNTTTTAQAGDTVKVAIDALNGYSLDESSIRITCGDQLLTYDKVTDGANVYYEFTMPAGDVQITADSYYNAHTISVYMQNASLDSLVDDTLTSNINVNSTMVSAGHQVSFTTTAFSGYTIVSVSIVNAATNEAINPISTTPGVYTFTMPGAGVNISVRAEKDKAALVIFDQDNTLRGMYVVDEGSTANVATDGTITVNGKTIAPKAVEGYTFSHWKITSNNDEFNSHSNISGYFVVKAVYTANAQMLSLAQNSSTHAVVSVRYPNGNTTSEATLTTSGTGVHTGDEINITADPDPYYKIVGVAVRAKNDTTVHAVATNLISVDDATGAWTYSFTMPSYDAEVFVYTEALPYNVNVIETNYPEGGTYTINGDTTTNADIKQGDQVNIAVKPEPGYYVDQVTVSYKDTNNGTFYVTGDDNVLYDTAAHNVSSVHGVGLYNIDFTMPYANVTVKVTYAKTVYTLDRSLLPDASWGSINLQSTATVGDVVNFQVVAKYGYNLPDDNLTIQYGYPGNYTYIKPTKTAETTDGSGNTTYTYQYTQPAFNVAVTATLVKNKYTNTFLNYDGTSVDTQTQDYLDAPTVPSVKLFRDGYHFVGWQMLDTNDSLTGGVYTSQDDFNQYFKTQRDTKIVAIYEKNTYGIVYDYDDTKGTVNGPNSAVYQDTVTVNVALKTGYKINTVTATYVDANNTKQTVTFTSTPANTTAGMEAGGNYVFTMPAVKQGTAVTFAATFTEITRSVYLNNVDHAAVVINKYEAEGDSVSANYKSDVVVKVTPDAGYQLSALTVTKRGTSDVVKTFTVAAAGGSYTFTMPAYDVDVNVTIIPIQYNISYNTPSNGTISPKATSANYKQVPTFTVNPAEGYQIKSVEAYYYDDNNLKQDVQFINKPTDLTVSNEYSFVMPMNDVQVNVVFEPITYNVVTGTITGNGAIRLNTTDTANITAKFADTVKVTATPDKGWYLESLTVTNNKTNGTVTYSPALAAAGGDYTFMMPSSDVTVTATFAKITYDIETVYDSDRGTITVQPTATEGENVEVTVTPKYGYDIKDVSGLTKDKKSIDGWTDSGDGSYQFTMPAKGVVITATFEKLTYQVTFLDYNNKPIGETQYIDYLDPATAPTAPTREGYTFTGWDKDFSSVTQDMTVTAQYKIKTPTVTVASTANGATSVNDTTPDYGSTVTVTADPADGYRYDSISVVTAGGKPVSSTFISESNNYVTTFTFTMPDDNVTVTVNYTEYASSDYTDVRTDAWYYTAINFVSDKGYFYGVSGNLFAPDQTMTRAMFVTVLGRLYGVDTSLYTTSSFEDVNANTWYGPYVAWAAANKIVAGYGDRNGNGTAEFGPNDNVTREQMAAIMYRYATFGGYDTSVKNQDWMTKYTDSGLASSYASDAIAWCVGNGIILGNSNTTINPLGNATRAEVAQVIKNFVDKVIYQ